jgi:glycerophosphoryl diester phosphodiesterase
MQLLGHRGVTGGTVQENTLDAFAKALNNGFEGIETDIRLTSDNRLILYHNRTLPNRKPVAQSTLKECASILGFNPPTLQEALESFPDCVWNLEVKTPDVLSQMHALRCATEKIDSLFFSSFDHVVLAQIKKLLARPAFALIANLPRDKSRFIDDLKGAQFDGVVWDYEVLRNEYVHYVGRNNRENGCYGIENSEELERCRLLGIKFAILDSEDLISREKEIWQ